MANINFSKFRLYKNNEDVTEKDVYLITDDAAQASISALDVRVTNLEGGGSGGNYLPLTGGTLANTTDYTLGLMPNQISFLNDSVDGTIITYDSINFGDSTTTRSFSFETGEVSIKDTNGTAGFDTQGHAWLTTSDADVLQITSPSVDHALFRFYANAGQDPTFTVSSAQTKIVGNFIVEGASTSTTINNSLVFKTGITLPTSGWGGSALNLLYQNGSINAYVPGPEGWTNAGTFALALQEKSYSQNGVKFSYDTEETANAFGPKTYIGPYGLQGSKGQLSAGIEYQPEISGFKVYDHNDNLITSFADTDTDWENCLIGIGANAGNSTSAAKTRVRNGVFYLTIDTFSFDSETINPGATNYWLPILTIPAGSASLDLLQASDSIFMGSITCIYEDGTDWKTVTCPIEYFKSTGQFRMNVAGTDWRNATSISVHEAYGTLAIPL